MTINLHSAALLLLALACSAQASAQDLHCHIDHGKAVTSLDQLPPQILALLERDKTGTDGIADIGGKFNPGDVIIDHSVPRRRLVGGVAGDDCIMLTVEYGGIGHYQKNLEYRLAAPGWTQLTATKAPRAPAHPPVAAH